MTDIAQLEAAFTRCREDEITCFVSFYGKRVSVTLTKYAYTGGTNTEFQIKGDGESVEAAFTNAFNNFPKNPLDGASKWQSDRLAALGKFEEGQFTEIKDANQD